MTEEIKNSAPTADELRRVQAADSLGADAIAGAGEEDHAKIIADEGRVAAVSPSIAFTETGAEPDIHDEMPEPRKLDSPAPAPRKGDNEPRLEAESLAHNMTAEGLTESSPK